MDNKSCWTRWVLVPFWVLQVLFELLTIAFAALVIAALQSGSASQSCQRVYYGGYYYTQCYSVNASVVQAATGVAGADLGLALVFLIMSIIQIVFYCKNRLTPPINFGIELPRFIIWLIIWIFVLVVAGKGQTTGAALFIAWPTLLFIFYLGSLTYACVIFHRYRTGYFGATGGSGVGRQQEVFDLKTAEQAQTSSEPSIAPYHHPSSTPAAPHNTTDTRAPLAPYVSPDSHV